MSVSPPLTPVAPARRLALPSFAPRVTYVLIAVNALVFVVDLLSNNLLTMYGALVPVLVSSHGQWWRIITVGFLHADILHITMNLYALYGVGRLMERFFGPWRLLAAYALSLSGSSILVTLLAPPERVTVGASGAIMGVLGALLVYFWKYRQLLVGAQGFLGRLGRMAVINIGVGLLPGISWWGHLGGFLAGAGAGAVLLPKYEHPDWAADHLEIRELDGRSRSGLAAIIAAEALLLAFWRLR